MGAGVPVLVIDVKGDLPNLLLAFPDFDSGRFQHEPALAQPEAQS